MADQRSEKIDHCRRHARHNDQIAEQDEQRHRQQDQRTDAFVDATRNHFERRGGGQQEIGDGRQSEAEGDRHAGEDAEPEQNRKENDEIPVADRFDPRTKHIESARQRGDDCYGEHQVAPTAIGAANQASHQHQQDADRQSGRAEGVIKPERRGMNEGLVLGEIVCWTQDQQKEQRRRRGAGRFDRAAHPARAHPNKRGHTHVLSTPLRNRRAEHRQPQEHDGGKFVRPGQWMVENEARNNARKQDEDFGDDHDGRQRLRGQSQQPIERCRHARCGRSQRSCQRRGAHPSLPTVCSSNVQPLSPNFSRQSL